MWSGLASYKPSWSNALVFSGRPFGPSPFWNLRFRVEFCLNLSFTRIEKHVVIKGKEFSLFKLNSSISLHHQARVMILVRSCIFLKYEVLLDNWLSNFIVYFKKRVGVRAWAIAQPTLLAYIKKYFGESKVRK